MAKCRPGHLYLDTFPPSTRGHDSSELRRHDALRPLAWVSGGSDQFRAIPNVDVRLPLVVDAVERSTRWVRALRDLGPVRLGGAPGAGRVFLFNGAEPRTEWLEGVIARDNSGFLLTGADLRPELCRGAHWYFLETRVPGISDVVRPSAEARSVDPEKAPWLSSSSTAT